MDAAAGELVGRPEPDSKLRAGSSRRPQEPVDSRLIIRLETGRPREVKHSEAAAPRSADDDEDCNQPARHNQSPTVRRRRRSGGENGAAVLSR